MPVTVALHHRTCYRYARPASLSPQTIRLRPAPHCRTPILSYAQKIAPSEHFVNWMQDPQGNYLARVVFPERIPEFVVEIDLVAELVPLNPFDFFLEDYAETFPFKYDDALAEELAPYLDPVDDVGPRWKAFVADIDSKPRQSVDFLVYLNTQVQSAISYLIRMEPGIQTPEQTLANGSGSCRDSAWLLISLLRRLGLAARFASGYLIQLTADQKAVDGPSGPEEDFTDLHAWAEVYLPGAGWIGLDATSGLLAGEGHIPLACSPNPTSAAPITGSLEDVETEFEFSMKVERLADPPRAARPYEESTWQEIIQAGETVDQSLSDQGIALTMGGEPTFISFDNPDAPEWNGAAVGAEKRILSENLMHRLWKRLAPGGLLHYGQGKWYPGESLPRWAFTCYWRPDGKPLWKSPERLATLSQPGNYKAEDAERFGRALAETLQVDPNCLIPAFEDVGYYLWKEKKLPINVDPIDNRLQDREERARIARVFESGLDKPRGWTLPLQRQQWQAKWVSGKWPLTSERLFLIPGDSPIGLRLPLESLPWVDAGDAPFTFQVDPFSIEPSRPLTPAAPPEARQMTSGDLRRYESYEEGNQIQRQKLPEEQREPKPGESASWIVRTALCVEPRDGQLSVFMPPLRDFETYLELVNAIESVAEKLDMKILIEGERPPFDPRVQQFSITPDPGVVEVNIHPAKSWKELCELNEILFQEAAHARLKPDKLMQDGRHTGSGGGCHIVLGGATPAESPFLKDPALLASMLAYWQRHPALSFLFSGLFIGPTSQSPRIDEARHDSLYELEIALRELERQESCPPWLVDRLFRHLLTDLTGNTHRAEFCIDKLYNPDRSSGRLGLLELRAFEMMPHYRMNAALQLLVRSLVAMLAKAPFKPRRLVRWGAELHDRFMLPHYLWDDFLDALHDLQQAGLPIKPEWFEAHFEFRFPLSGKFRYKEIEVELRQAIEPWHTLGEEATAGGTARYVDSSLDRLQIKANQFQPERYELRCNSLPLPLENTGRQGEYVAGLRYRAWQPPSCLHPTIPVDTPLYIDLVDTWTNRAVAGCRYHSGHPGGRSFDDSPINSLEAAGRWTAKFDAHGHTPGPAKTARSSKRPQEYPLTLDMRLK